MSFSNDGMYILLGTSSNFHYVLDAFSLGIVRRLTGHQGLGEQGIEPNRGKSGEEVCWTGDAKWVMSGSADGSVCMWDLTPPAGQEKLQASDVLGPGDVKPNFLNMNGNNDRPPTMQPTIRLQNKGGAGAGATRAVRFNPKLCMMATGGDDLVSPTFHMSILRSLTDSHASDTVVARKGRQDVGGRRLLRSHGPSRHAGALQACSWHA